MKFYDNLCNKIQLLCQNGDVTLFMVLLTAFEILFLNILEDKKILQLDHQLQIVIELKLKV